MHANDYRLAYLRWLQSEIDDNPPAYDAYGITYSAARAIRDEIDPPLVSHSYLLDDGTKAWKTTPNATRGIDDPSPTARRPMSVNDCYVPQKRLFDMFDSTALFPVND